VLHQGARRSAIALRTSNELKERLSPCLKLYTCASNGNKPFCMRTNVSVTSNISRRRARFDHDAIDDGHAKHGLQMRNHAAWLSLTTPILTASGEDQDEAQHIHDILDEKIKFKRSLCKCGGRQGCCAKLPCRASETVRIGRSIVVIKFLLREKRGSVGRSEGSATALLAATNVSDSIGVWSRCANPRLVASISCHESLRGPLACEAGCARSFSNCTNTV
jgi:hypothetical protein